MDGGSELTNEVGARASLAWALYHDYALDLHLQAFARVRVPFEFERTTPLDPTDAAQTATMGVQAAFRRGLFNVRGEFGVQAGGGAPHPLSVRGAAALLLGGGFGFIGVDVMGDVVPPGQSPPKPCLPRPRRGSRFASGSPFRGVSRVRTTSASSSGFSRNSTK